MVRALPFLATFLVIGCNPFARKNPAADADAGVVAATPVPAPSAVAMPSAGAVPAAAQSAWPVGTNQELRLTWAVYPAQGTGESAKRNLELVARIGDVARRFPLGPQQGGLHPQAQGVCEPARKGPNEVAEIAFYLGGETSFVAKRTNPALIEVVSTSGPDVECKSCEKTRVVASFPVPADARVVEAISDIQGAGKEAPFDCTPPTKLTTVAGEISIDDGIPGRYVVMLGKKMVFESLAGTPGSKPQLFTRAKAKAGFDEVLVFSQISADSPQKGCMPYGYWFLGLKTDGSYKTSRTVPYCGSSVAGPRPSIASAPDKMTLTLPARAKTGTSTLLPAETWVFEGGAVRKL